MRLDNEVAKEEKSNNENTRGREPSRNRGCSKKGVRGLRGQVNPTARWGNFKCSNKGVIRSANKDRSADIPIDGEGNLLLYTNTPKREKFILGNVIAASGLSENLLSLAKFAEAGFGVYLDDEILDIFDKKTGESFIMGTYETPSWIVNFDVRENEREGLEENFCEYQCIARLVTASNLSEQLQPNSTEQLAMQGLEGESDSSALEQPASGRTECGDVLVAVGRENMTEDCLQEDCSQDNIEETKTENKSREKEIKISEVVEVDLQKSLEEKKFNFDTTNFIRKPVNIDELEEQQLIFRRLIYRKSIPT